MGLVYHGFEGGSDGTDIPSSGAALGVGDAAITVFHGVTAGATASHAKYSAAQASGGGLAAAFSVDALDSAGTAASTTTGQVYVQLPFTATANPSAHFYYYRTALPNSATHQIARFIAGTNSASGTLRQTTAGKLELDTDFGVASRLALTNALPLNTWVRIELVINYSTAGAGSVSVKAYNATTSALLDSAAVTGLTMTTATVQAFRVGLMTGVANVPTWYVDNIAAGDNANAEVGPYAAPANPSTSAAANLSQVSSFTASAVGTTASSASLTTGSTLTASAGSFNSSTGAAALSSGSAATADVSVTARPTTALFQTSTLSASSDSVAVAAGSALAESSALSAVFSTGPNFAIISHPSQTSFITANVKQTVPSQGSLAQPVTLAADAVVTAPPTVAHLAQGSSFAVDATTRGTTFAIDSTLSQTSYLSTGATVRTNVSAAAVLTAATNLGPPRRQLARRLSRPASRWRRARR